MPDLVVIGAGLAGLSAALTAAEAGLSVRVVAKGMGALHWSAGTIDVMGYTPDDEPVDKPLDSIAQLTMPHPYTLFGVSAVREALTWFEELTSRAGCAVQQAGAEETNSWLPSPAGAKRPAYLVPSAQMKGDLHQNTPMLIVGFDGMRDLYPELIATNLVKQGFEARAAHLPVGILTDRTDFNNVHLAQALDDLTVRRRLAERLSQLARAEERIGLPAILGYDHHDETLHELQQITASSIFEIPTLPPSIAGIRLHHALTQELNRLGVRVEIGMEVIGASAHNQNIQWVETETSARPLRHRASAFLLATGGVLGGGFNSDSHGNFMETIFDLPLNAPSSRSQWFRSEFLDPAGQPIFQAGVTVDQRGRPLKSTGEPIYDNLWCAGALLAHTDPIRERSHEGLSITSGRVAAQDIIAELSVKTVAT